jgi:hypothetical protein
MGDMVASFWAGKEQASKAVFGCIHQRGTGIEGLSSLNIISEDRKQTLG